MSKQINPWLAAFRTIISVILMLGAALSNFAQLQKYTPYPPAASSDTSVGLIIFFVFIALSMVGLAVLCVWSIIGAITRGSNRAGKLRTLAQQLGFSYTQKPSVPDFLHNTMFAQRSPLAVGGGMNNLLQGNVNGIPILIFDFGYTQAIGRIVQTHRQTVACIPRGSNLPFILYQENRIVEPENIQMFVGEAIKALNHG